MVEFISDMGCFKYVEQTYLLIITLHTHKKKLRMYNSNFFSSYVLGKDFELLQFDKEYLKMCMKKICSPRSVCYEWGKNSFSYDG